MIDTHQLKNRDLYLNKILAFQDTGAGKSCYRNP